MKTVETLTIPRTVLTKLVKRNRQLIYMNYFLVHLCAVRNIDLVFMADEVCRMLKITPEQLEAARKKRLAFSIAGSSTMRPTSFCWRSCSDGKRSLRKTGSTDRTV